MGHKQTQSLRFLLLLAPLLLALPGCDSLILHTMIDAPNKNSAIEPASDPSLAVFQAQGYSHQFRVEIPSPPASLFIRIIDPEPDNPHLLNHRPRATILVLHGYRGSSDFPISTVAQAFAKKGFRAILVDLRGHGRSTGQYITYGSVESRDLVQVLDDLDRRKLIQRPLGVWGVSMGASIAIQLASIDSRPQSIVAVAPYTSMRDIVPHFVRHFLPFSELYISDDHIASLIDTAAQKAEFNPDYADSLAAIRNVHIPILIMHGSIDSIVPAQQGRTLADANPQCATFTELPLFGHFTAIFDFNHAVTNASTNWFAQHLTPPSD